MNVIKMFDTSKITNLLSGNYNEVFSKYFIGAAIPILIIAMLNCFLGHKIFKVFVGIAGIVIGAGAGAGFSIGIKMFMKQDMPGLGMIVISMILGALILGLASFKFYKAGAFCMGLITGMILGVVIMKIFNKDEYIIAAVIGGLLMGLLAIDLYKHMVIILTSVNGALIAAACIAMITENDDPVYILKLGAGLSIAGIIVQYKLSLFGKRKNEEEDEDIEDDDIVEEKEKKTKERVAKKKKKKVVKKNTKIKEIRVKKKTDKKATKKAAKQKQDNNSSGLFLVDIISNIAQFIKDKIVNYLNAEDIEDDDYYEDEDEDYENYDFEDEEKEDAYYEEIEDKDVDYVVEDKKQQTTLVNKRIIIKDTNDNLNSIMNVEKALEKTLEENINIPIFDYDEVGQKLVEELDKNIKIQSNEELEDLIIKQTIQNLEI